MDESDGHLLIVEPDASHVELIRLGLQASPWADRLEVVPDLGGARARLRDQKPALVLTRFDLHDGQGMDLAEPTNGLPRCGVVVMDEIVEETRAVEAIKRGALDYVVKSKDLFSGLPRVLERALREWENLERRHLAEQREAHLKQVLLAIRNVNQLITRETDRDRLIQQACENLIETRGYFTAWIVLRDEAGVVQGSATAGDVVHFEELVKQLEAGRPVHCVQETAEEASVQVFMETRAVCGPCPLAVGRTDRAALATALAFEGKRYGLLVVSLPAELAGDTEEQGLFEEVAGDLGFALSKIEDAEALRETQEFARSTIDSLSAHVCVLDADGVIIAVNRAWRDFAEANPPVRGNLNEGVNYLTVCDEAEGRDADLARAFAEGIRSVSRGERDQFQLEYPCHSPTDRRWFMGRVTRFVGESPCRVVISHENITDRKLAEESLEFQSMLLDQIGDSVTATDLDGVIRYVNAANARLLGRSREELIGKTVHAYGEDPERGATQQEIIERTRADGSYQGEVVNAAKDGSERTMFVRTWMLHDEVGSPNGMCGIATDITDRKLAEEALRESEEKYRSILEHIEEGYYEVDLAGHFTFFNESTCRILGYDRDQLMGMNNRQYMDKANARAVYRMFNQVYRTGVPAQSFDWELIRKDGARCAVEASVSLMRDAQDRPVGFRGIFRDITARKRAQEELRRKTEMLERTEQIARIGSWQWEIATDTVTWSDELFRIFQLDPSEGAVSYADHARLYPPEDLERLRQAVEVAVNEGVPYELELRATRPTGEIRHCIVRGNPETDQNGRVVRLVGSLQDITESKRAMDAYTRLCEMATEFICVADITTTTFLQVNPAFERELGYTEAELLGRPFLDFIHPDDVAPTLAVIEEKLRQGHTVVSFENRYRCKDGSYRHLVWNSHPTPEEGLTFAIAHDITERKAAEEALRESERLLSKSQEVASLGSWELDLLENRLFWSDQVYRLFGVDPDAFAASYEGFLELVHPEDRSAVDAAYRESYTQGLEGYEIEHRVIRRDTGQVRWVHEKCEHIRDEAGRVIRSIGMVQDVTERREAEQALRASEESYRQIVETANEGIWVIDAEARTAFVNRRMAELLGYEPEEMIGTRLHDHAVGPWSQLADVELERRRQGAPGKHDFEFRRKDGSSLWAIVSANPIYDDGGSYVGALGMVTDITDRRQAEQALAEKTRHLESVTENSPDVLFRYDRELRHVFINRRAETLTGWSAEHHLGKTHRELGLPESLCDLFETAALGVFEGGEPSEIEFVFPSPDGPRTCQTRMVPEFSSGGDVETVLGIVRDVTEQRQAEEHHRRLEAKMQHAQKLESLGVLAGGIAHDFNNLLVGILGNASLALMDLPPHAPAREGIQQIEEAAQRAAELTNQMLAYSGRGKFVVQPLGLNELVGEMAHLLESVISKKAALRFDLVQDLPAIEGDATQLRQVIMNLITNAAEAIGDQSGIVLIRTSVLDIDRSYITRAMFDDTLTEGRYVGLEVSDTGCGMDEETRAKMFDPFFTSKFSGRGLGLAAVLGIVRGHQGAINVYSEPGRGTTIKVLLPVCGRQIAQSVESVESGGEWHAEGTMLVIDDERSVLEVARRALERAGFRVLTAETGREGVLLFAQHADEVRAVLLDMTMPDMNGEETFRELRAIRPDVKVILSSGYNEQEVTSRFAGKGLAGFIQKPYQVRSLIDRVRRVLS